MSHWKQKKVSKIKGLRSSHLELVWPLIPNIIEYLRKISLTIK